jgi:hypothetical protein
MSFSLLWTASLLLGALLFAVPIKIAAWLLKAAQRSYGRCFMAALGLLALAGLLELSVPPRWAPLLWLLASGLILALVLRTGIGRAYLVMVLQLPIMALLVVALLLIPALHVSLQTAPDDVAALLQGQPPAPAAQPGFPAAFDTVLKQQVVGSWVLVPDSADQAPLAAREVFNADGRHITYFYDGPDCANVIREIDATWTVEHGVLISRIATAAGAGTSQDRILSVGDRELVLRSLDDGGTYVRQRSNGCTAGSDDKAPT